MISSIFAGLKSYYTSYCFRKLLQNIRNNNFTDTKLHLHAYSLENDCVAELIRACRKNNFLIQNLQEISLEGNNITTFNLDDLSIFQSLNRVNLKDNKLKKVSLTKKNISLKTLRIDNNNITEVSITGENIIEKLFVSNNFLTKFEGQFLPQLEKLEIENNNLNVFNSQSMNKLIMLKLSNNEINKLHIGNLNNLKKLYVDNNILTSFNHDLPNLETLFISNNKLSYFKNIYPKLTNLVVRSENLVSLSLGKKFHSLFNCQFDSHHLTYLSKYLNRKSAPEHRLICDFTSLAFLKNDNFNKLLDEHMSKVITSEIDIQKNYLLSLFSKVSLINKKSKKNISLLTKDFACQIVLTELQAALRYRVYTIEYNLLLDLYMKECKFRKEKVRSSLNLKQIQLPKDFEFKTRYNELIEKKTFEFLSVIENAINEEISQNSQKLKKENI